MDVRILSRVFFQQSEPLRALDLALRVALESSPRGTRARVRVLGANRAEVRIRGTRQAPPGHCLTTLAFLRDALHLATGARVEAREERCVERGDSHCAHRLDWSPFPAA